MKLRDYQRDAVDSIFKYYEDGNKGNPIISAATGAGKSLILGEFIKIVLQKWPSEKIIMATHVADLVGQNYQKVIAQWPDAPVGIYSAGLGKRQPWASIVCGGIQSVHKKAHLFGYRSILLIDECQLLSPHAEGMYMSFIKELKKNNPHLKVVGLSATPWRQKGGSLVNQENAIFTDIIYDIGLKYLVDQGYLSPLIGKSSIIQADLSKFTKGRNEFTQEQMSHAMDNVELINSSIDEIEELAKDRKYFMFFCAGIQHAHHATSVLRSRGWDADCITGDTSQEERTRLLNKFRNSKTRYALVNNTVLTTGTDLPNADCLVLWRPTKSSSLYVQIAGRGARPVYAPGFDLSTNKGRLNAIAQGPKRNCLILDYAGNIERFGAVDLIAMPPAKSKNKNDQPTIAPQKICPKCREPNPIVARQCHCGHEFEFDDSLKHGNAASTGAIMSSEIKPEKFKIHKVIYKTHMASSGYPSLRVQYYDLFGFVASEFVAFSNPKGKFFAEKWFAERKPNDLSALDWAKLFPGDTSRAFAMRDRFAIPKTLYAKKSGKYMDITGFEF